jgi:peptidoglycan hydrolase-like protein with peptidoglycan-binding domain
MMTGPTRRLRRIALLSTAMLLAVASPAAADYYEAVTAYELGNYAAAGVELEPLAAAGDPRAQLLLGRMYAAGQGVLQDYVRAHVLFNLAAATGMKGAAEAREELAARMTPAQIADAQQQAAARIVAPPEALGAAEPAAGEPSVGEPMPAPLPAAAPALIQEMPILEAPPLARQALVDLQWQLALHGYDPGPADGNPGPRTLAAIRHYQADAGLPVDGVPTQAVLDHLQYTVPAVRNAAAPVPVVRRAAVDQPVLPGPLDSLDPGLRRIYIVGIQEGLKARGYNPGPIDGVAGGRTREAIRRYQAAAGLPVDGQPSPELLNHLKFVGGQVAAGF